MTNLETSWAGEVLELAAFSNEDEAERYRILVESKMGHCSLEVARILMKTFSTHEDYGVQECVVSVLASAELQDYLRALLEELPRLLIDAREWAFVLVGREVLYHTTALIQVALEMEQIERRALATLLIDEEFAGFYDQAGYVANEVSIPPP